MTREWPVEDTTSLAPHELPIPWPLVIAAGWLLAALTATGLLLVPWALPAAKLLVGDPLLFLATVALCALLLHVADVEARLNAKGETLFPARGGP